MIPEKSRKPLNVTLLTHSTLPRGGVVHALALGDALAEAGHQVRLLAPTLPGEALFRAPVSPQCRFIGIPATRVQASVTGHPGGDLALLVKQRIDDWLHYFDTSPDALNADIFHAQDPISANALADLVARKQLPGFVRTVHHLDNFTHPQLAAWQRRGYLAATRVCCVSERWRDALQREEGIDAAVVSNGVDRHRFSPERDHSDIALQAMRSALMDSDTTDAKDATEAARSPIFLSVGGVESRKNTLHALAAYVLWRRGEAGSIGSDTLVTPAAHPHPHHAQWWIAGGASLLDHRDYGRRFLTMAQEAGLSVGTTLHSAADIVLLGRIDDTLMPALFRSADALLFPSLVEGFGLVVLEALSVGTPVVTSRIAPFTEYLPEAAVEWADPLKPESIAAAMHRAIQHRFDAGEQTQATNTLRQQAGFAVAASFAWTKSAAQHIDLYRRWHADRTFEGLRRSPVFADPSAYISYPEPHHA